MKMRKSSNSYYKIWFTILAIIITIRVLFITPSVGIADQGDFNRIMTISGLSLLDSDTSNPNFIRFYNYIVTDYKISHIDNVFKTIVGSSLGYLVVFITYTCKVFGQNVFKTQYLAIIYSTLYIITLSIILNFLNIKDKVKFILVSSLTLFIFFDGNYLIWFNSLYGEPMMLVTLLLFIASVFNYIHYKYVVKGTKKIMSKIVYILLITFLFLGSKLQAFTALPFVILLVGKIIWDNKRTLNKGSLISLCTLLCLVIAYPVGISMNSDSLNLDTEYNSVFYGVLNGSKTPEQDLIDLGLNPDMAVEAGKHAYFPTNEYVKYAPSTKITDQEFYSKINNVKLAKFYLTHPTRLLKGMEYTASKSFNTSTGLGKNYQSYSETPVTDFYRFTGWSYFRKNMLPKNLFFIISVYLIVFLFSIYKYVSNKSNPEIKIKLLLLWTIMLIGIIQFPMPFVGNGQADTSKQLFLFNFIFDGLLVIIYSYILFKIDDLIKHKFKK
ncbi:MAG: hypothetical protein LLF98_06935 [Clostridium sp.]|uniref:glycan biosynthesis hexose transferase WsfD n=1 Tax=Clostridium sp. TaxID=1506 RepID=UPI0025BC48D7|nr:hypothetical protein [Clostridium sp.]MCE5220990.1 hypothetical protein [Clostridium sp.]